MLFKHKRVLYTFLIIGGEPTVHGNIVELIRSARVLKECTDAGLEKVNFSIFRTTPEELVEVQNAKYGNVRLVGIKLVAFYNAQLIPLLETILKLM